MICEYKLVNFQAKPVCDPTKVKQKKALKGLLFWKNIFI